MPQRARRSQPPHPSLPLALPAPGPFVGRIQPEVAVPCAAPFDSDEWSFTVDWEGTRALLFSAEDGIRLQGETLRDITRLFPELGGAAESLEGRRVVLDGVVTVLDPQGRPDLTAHCRRLVLGRTGSHSLPAVFLATDVLHLDGEPTMSWPLDRRLATLAEVVPTGVRLQVPDCVTGQGRALAAAAEDRLLGGLLARRRSSRYHPGMASPDRMRIDLLSRAHCVVAGVTQGTVGPRHLLLAEHVDGRLLYSGEVPIDLAAPERAWLERQLRSLATPRTPLDDADIAGEWIRPQLTAVVSHGGRHPDGTLREPRLMAVRADCDPSWCMRREPVPPPSNRSVEPRRFSLTVLSPLPLPESGL